MGKTKLQNDFKIFREHCEIIKRDYNTYNDLFFSGSDELLTKAASLFFDDIAAIMQRDWMVQVCKLMDHAETMKKGKVFENISIRLINSQLKNEGLISDEINDLTRALLDYGEKILPARHKRLVHFDRFHHINGIVLGSTTEEELKNFLDNIQQYCDVVGRAVDLGPLDFSSSACPGDALDLLRVLREYYENN